VFNPFKPKSRIKEKTFGGKSDRRFISERGRKSILLEGIQAIPARLSDKDRMAVKKLGWWVVKA
jgi:hypothetical protein